MNVDVPAGQLAAVGPGWVSSVRYGRKLLQDAGRNSRPVRSQPGSSQLNYLRVEFQKGIGGDLFKREVTFRDRVSVIYGPVSGWDEQLDGRRREGLGERDVLLDCNILKVADLGPPGGGRRSIELEASGNTTVQGRTFVGRGGRIKYVEAKDMLVLESDGRSDAVLARQSSPGQPPAEVRARTITYWLSSRDVMLGDVRSLNLDDLRSTKVFPQRNVAPQDALPRGGPPH
jgi:hypothetical protein